MLYYWALAVLSGRSFDDLGQADFPALQSCITMSDQDSGDEWLAALDVIMRFVSCQTQPDIADEELERAAAAYDAIEAIRRDEIRRHRPSTW